MKRKYENLESLLKGSIFDLDVKDKEINNKEINAINDGKEDVEENNDVKENGKENPKKLKVQNSAFSQAILNIKEAIQKPEKPFKEKVIKEKIKEKCKEKYKEKYKENPIPEPIKIEQKPLRDPNEFGVKMVEPYALFPHQIEAVKFIVDVEDYKITNPYFKKGRGCLLEMAMGFGKSVSLGTVCMRTLENQRMLGQPSLFVTEKILLETLRFEFEKFFGNQINVLVYHGDFLKTDYVKVDASFLKKYDVVITTYATVEARFKSAGLLIVEKKKAKLKSSNINSEQIPEVIPILEPKNLEKSKNAKEFCQMGWYRVILDESHIIRNRNTQTFRVVNQLYSQIRICMTGTVMFNDIKDVYSQLEFIGLQLPKEIKKTKQTLKNLNLYNMMKFVKKAPSIKLPNKTIFRRYFDLSPHERFLHSFYKNRAQLAFNNEQSNHKMEVNGSFIRSLQICSAPYLVTKISKMGINSSVEDMASVDEPEIFPAEPHLDTWIRNKKSEAGLYSSKMRALHQLLNEIAPTKQKVIIFANFTSTLRLAIESLDSANPYFKNQMVYVHGGITCSSDRDKLFDKFRKDPDCFYLFLTLKIGGIGLNLVEASAVIFLENWYNYATHDQADSRVHRIGQTKEVSVYYLIAKDSVDEEIHKIAQDKKVITDSLSVDDEITPIEKVNQNDVYKLLFQNYMPSSN